MNIIKLLNKICAVNISEPCRDDLKRLFDESQSLYYENERLRDENQSLKWENHRLICEIKIVLTHPSYNSDEKLCEIKLLIDEVNK